MARSRAEDRDPTDLPAELQWRAENWFIHRGVPHLIVDYNARSDIFTRAWWVLAVVFVAEMLSPVNQGFAWWLNLLAVLAGFGVLLGALALVNRYRGRPWYRRPETIGVVELAVFVLVPPLLPLVFGLHGGSALALLGFNVVLLGLVYVVFSFGLLSMTRWAVRQLFVQIAAVGDLVVRSLPLLLIFTMFMFVNAEIWKVATSIPGVFYGIAIALLVVAGSLFLLIRLPRELEDVSTFASWTEVAELATSTPLGGVGVEGLTDPPDPPPLDWRGRFNVGLLLFVSQATQILFVTAGIGAFYCLFGLFIVQPDTIAQWTSNADPGVIAQWSLLDHEVVVTGALVRSAAFIAAIAGLQFTVSALTDRTYREDFLGGILSSMRVNFAARAVYVARVFSSASSARDHPIA